MLDALKISSKGFKILKAFSEVDILCDFSESYLYEMTGGNQIRDTLKVSERG